MKTLVWRKILISIINVGDSSPIPSRGWKKESQIDRYTLVGDVRKMNALRVLVVFEL